MNQEIIFTNEVGRAIDSLVERLERPDRAFVIADTNTDPLVVDSLAHESKAVAGARRIVVPSGEGHKNITTLCDIWKALCDGGATRRSLVLNVGGGVVTDMGGFAAATFKRGIRFVNVPTTILAAVDAAVGGKTGIDFEGYKNEIGAFAPAVAVIVSSRFFGTLPQEEVRSGFAEMIKHSLLEGGETYRRLTAKAPWQMTQDEMLQAVSESVMVKKRIADADPTEKGLRKALNLGHTAGHAMESHALASGRPVPHGYAVAWGLVVDLVLSHMRYGLDSALIHSAADYIREIYGTPTITCDDYPALLDTMLHDKKNTGDGSIAFTLLREPGQVEVNDTVDRDTVAAALDIMRDLFGI